MRRPDGPWFTAGIALLASGPAWAGGPVCSVIDPIWETEHERAEAALVAGVDGMAAEITAQNTITTEEVVSAVRILTQQRGYTDNQIALSDSRANEAGASAITANATRLAIQRAEETYGPLGQAPDACDVAERMAELTESVAASAAFAQGMVTDAAIDARPGGVVDLDEAVRRRLATASPETVDVTRSLLDPSASEEVQVAFVNNLAGMPLEKVPVGEGGVAAGRADLAEYMGNVRAERVEAMRSAALYSLGMIQAAGAEVGHAGDAGGEDASLDAHLQWLVDRYGGGADHETWSAELATKTEGGIAKEIARLRSISMMLRRMGSEGDERMTVLLATMIAQEADDG